MSMTHIQLRKIFAKFWEEKDHKLVPPIPLVPRDDPTTLFTGSGMQQLVPYLLGQPHPLGKKLYNIQPCFRSQDIEEIGDNRHTTFFEMMGNWSLGAYFKEEQLALCWEFFTKKLGLPKNKLYVTVFSGTKSLPKDEESAIIWKKIGIPNNHIFYYGPEKNWWSRSGLPENMPVGEPGGPDSEVFYEFTQVAHNPKFGSKCHPNCNCGRFLEIGNSVFMQYCKQKDNKFKDLPKRNVDFGAGLERILAALNNDPDIFKIDVLWPIIEEIQNLCHFKYRADQNRSVLMRVIADHIRSATMIAKDGITPSNKDQGYFERRILRKMVRIGRRLGVEKNLTINLLPTVVKIFKPIYKDLAEKQEVITKIFKEEEEKFIKTINIAQKEVQKILQGKNYKNESQFAQAAFLLFQSNGYPPEMFLDDLKEKGITLDWSKFTSAYKQIFTRHQAVSKRGMKKKFKGGLADSNIQTIKYHTATHLLHQALFDILGEKIRQEGSNITAQRLRFDFYSPVKPDQKQIKEVEKIINQKIREELPVVFKILPKKEAYRLGAKSFFREKYPQLVKVYFVGDYSKEFCGGPHVKNTKEIGSITIFKFERIGRDLYRIYAK